MSISAKFLGSYPTAAACPADVRPEFAFAGRSNVGKSSLINRLFGVRRLAKVSSRPGKTRHLNLFSVVPSSSVRHGGWLFMDMPGYGYARLSKAEKARIERENRAYLLGRSNLVCVVLLLDLRLSLQASDRGFLRWLGACGLPVVLVFTKADKLSRTLRKTRLLSYHKALADDWEALPSEYICSAHTGEGGDALHAFFEKVVKRFYADKGA